jgi:ketosteroid isomerase-like protein
MAQRKGVRKPSVKRSPTTRRPIATKFLDAFADAWNRHDVDRLMTFMDDDCVFEASAGPEVCGTRYEGRDQVRNRYAEVFATFPDARWAGARHVISGNRGVSEWTFSGTRADGTRVEVTGCDLYVTGREHSATGATGSAWEPTPWRAARGTARDALPVLPYCLAEPRCFSRDCPRAWTPARARLCDSEDRHLEPRERAAAAGWRDRVLGDQTFVAALDHLRPRLQAVGG